VRYFRTNQKFHDSVVQAAHNDVLTRTHAGLNAHLKRLRYKKMHSRTPQMQAHFIEEHDAIAQALMRRDGAAVDSQIKHHLARVGAMLGAPD
jgi:DNA-binding GntR family transcriptional regulator